MKSVPTERRQRRSQESAIALRYQLEHSREKGRLKALVVTDESGLLVASVGAEKVCEELGAMAPVFGRTFTAPSDLPTLEGGEIAIRTLRACGESFYLAALGGGVARDAILESTRAGVSRILSAN
ncbi:MAG: hypothetical protein GXY23_09025 [Myxococcales bacterium]|nr:hypothetical protein [Myxococcales bacterium]